MFHQLVTPVQHSLLLSFAAGAVPIGLVLALLGVLRWPAWQASLAGLAVSFALAVGVWKLPALLAVSSFAAGATFAAWPVMWIVLNALLLYNIAVASGRFEAFRTWMLDHLPNDRRVVLVVVGFSFGSLLEGVAGFGAPVAVTGALLIALGFKAGDALAYALIFNTAPVAFGALGAPVATQGAVTQQNDATLGAMIGRQLPIIAFILPFYVIGVLGGLRAIRGVWPVLLVAGGSFAIVQFLSSNAISYALTDVLSSLTSLIATIAFVKVWRPRADAQYALVQSEPAPSVDAKSPRHSAWQGWVPWIVLSATVIVWVQLKLNLIGEMKIAWPLLHNQVFITVYGRPYPAIWTFQPLATGTAILAANVMTALILRVSPGQLARAFGATLRQVYAPLATTMLIVGLAYLMNYSGIAYTLGVGIASAGLLFPLVSAFLGWLAVFLSGSDTSGNALFGNLQVVAARQLNLSPVLMAATNASGGVMGKMISPQNIATGAATTACKGREGDILAKTLPHSIVLTLLLGLIVLAQQYVFPSLIP
jgi:lactate permease